jgi:hypothetical protein
MIIKIFPAPLSAISVSENFIETFISYVCPRLTNKLDES